MPASSSDPESQEESFWQDVHQDDYHDLEGVRASFSQGMHHAQFITCGKNVLRQGIGRMKKAQTTAVKTNDSRPRSTGRTNKDTVNEGLVHPVGEVSHP